MQTWEYKLLDNRDGLIEQKMNDLGQKGWRLVGIFAAFVIMERETNQEQKPAPPKPEDTEPYISNEDRLWADDMSKRA